jgi:hypothetical protein
MKAQAFVLLGAMILVAGCEREPVCDPSIGEVNGSHCKSFSLKGGQTHPASEDCIGYEWVKGDTLKITHFNAGFNCCPEGFRTELTVAGDTLIISEMENSNLCDCNCLYDLKYDLTGIERDRWWIRVREPYVDTERDAPALFQVNLKEQPAGEACFTRTGYPWNIQ